MLEFDLTFEEDYKEMIIIKENVFYEEGIKNTEIQNVSSNQNAKQTKEETA